MGEGRLDLIPHWGQDVANSFSTTVGAVPTTSSQCFPSPCAAEERVAPYPPLLTGAASIPAWGGAAFSQLPRRAHHGQGSRPYHTRWELPAFMLVSSLFFYGLNICLYFCIFSLTFSLSSPTDKIKSIFISSSGLIFTVLFIATIPSVTKPAFLDNGIEFFTICGMLKLPLPINFSLFISYSKSPTVSQSVDKVA